MDDSHLSQRDLTIVLATTIPGVLIVSLCALLYCKLKRRRTSTHQRDATPIADEEIESWKRDEEKSSPQQLRPAHQATSSVNSIQKPPSVIVYTPNQHRGSIADKHSPCSTPIHKSSLDVPQTPVLARAPNSRPGLTDDMIQGDDAYIAQAKRQPSKLAKTPRASIRHQRALSTRTIAGTDAQKQWSNMSLDKEMASRKSLETFSRANSLHNKSLEAAGTPLPLPARFSFDSEVPPGGLSPRPPIHQSEIGRAIG